MGRNLFLLHFSTSLFLGLFFCSTATVQRDITTPLTTSPTLNSNPIPEKPETWDPFTTPTPSSGTSWCIASETAGQAALQTALDYACGKGGADCTAIQPGGRCYNPSSLYDHASYAFNDYYQKNPIPNSCNFGGTAVITTIDPSSRACEYPPTSISSSVLDTANQNGSTVFGIGPSNSAMNLVNKVAHLYGLICLLFLLLRND
ncbi:major pollen allergen Ole e 10-like [Silene latifolia]|uniref:major pollen allergen Ole e 10-like n=1 Tax=Silene latifolia TaxID=37657 RepID=UPI003D76DE9D